MDIPTAYFTSEKLFQATNHQFLLLPLCESCLAGQEALGGVEEVAVDLWGAP